MIDVWTRLPLVTWPLLVACGVPSLSPVLARSRGDYFVAFKKCARFDVDVRSVSVFKDRYGSAETCSLTYECPTEAGDEPTCPPLLTHAARWRYGQPVAGYTLSGQCPALEPGHEYVLMVEHAYVSGPERSRVRILGDGRVQSVDAVCD